MLTERDILMQREIYQDMVRNAEHDHVVQLAQAEKRAGLAARAMAWIGGRLAAWGRQLQERYGDASLAPQTLATRTSVR